jgi:hypothetical protein
MPYGSTDFNSLSSKLLKLVHALFRLNTSTLYFLCRVIRADMPLSEEVPRDGSVDSDYKVLVIFIEVFA